MLHGVVPFLPFSFLISPSSSSWCGFSRGGGEMPCILCWKEENQPPSSSSLGAAAVVALLQVLPMEEGTRAGAVEGGGLSRSCWRRSRAQGEPSGDAAAPGWPAFSPFFLCLLLRGREIADRGRASPGEILILVLISR